MWASTQTKAQLLSYGFKVSDMNRIVTIGIGMLESISKISDLAQKAAIEKFLIQLGIHLVPDMNWDQLCIMDHGKDCFQIPFESQNF